MSKNNPLIRVLPFGDLWCVAFVVSQEVKGIFAVRQSQSTAESVAQDINQTWIKTQGEVRVSFGDKGLPAVNMLVSTGDNRKVLDWLIAGESISPTELPAKIDSGPQMIDVETFQKTQNWKTQFPKKLSDLTSLL